MLLQYHCHTIRQSWLPTLWLKKCTFIWESLQKFTLTKGLILSPFYSRESIHFLEFQKQERHPFTQNLMLTLSDSIAHWVQCYVVFPQEEPLDWDLHLPYLVAAYNATPHDSTGLSPNYLMFGRELGQPADMLLDPPTAEQVNIPRYALHLQETLRRAHDYAAEHLGKSVASYKQSHDGHVAGRPFSVGDIVWLLHIERQVGHSAKLEQRAIGPYLVIAKLGSNYRIAKSPEDPGKVVHYNRMRLCKGSTLVSWLPPEPKFVSTGTSTDPDLLGVEDNSN